VEISDALERGQAFLLVFLKKFRFFYSKMLNLIEKEVFWRKSCEFLVNKKL